MFSVHDMTACSMYDSHNNIHLSFDTLPYLRSAGAAALFPPLHAVVILSCWTPFVDNYRSEDDEFAIVLGFCHSFPMIVIGT